MKASLGSFLLTTALTHNPSVIFEGKLSEPLNTKEVDISKLGLLMGGKNE